MFGFYCGPDQFGPREEEILVVQEVPPVEIEEDEEDDWDEEDDYEDDWDEDEEDVMDERWKESIDYGEWIEGQYNKDGPETEAPW